MPEPPVPEPGDPGRESSTLPETDRESAPGAGRPRAHLLPLHPRYALALLLRATLVWLACRTLTALAGRSVVLEPAATGALLLLVAGLVYLDARRSDEPTFHANLGVAAPWIGFVALAGAGVAEAIGRALLAFTSLP